MSTQLPRCLLPSTDEADRKEAVSDAKESAHKSHAGKAGTVAPIVSVRSGPPAQFPVFNMGNDLRRDGDVRAPGVAAKPSRVASLRMTCSISFDFLESSFQDLPALDYDSAIIPKQWLSRSQIASTINLIQLEAQGFWKLIY